MGGLHIQPTSRNRAVETVVLTLKLVQLRLAGLLCWSKYLSATW